MMIMPQLKLVFIHIYKTGGTSLTRLLAPYTDPRYRAEEPQLDGPGFQATWHFEGRQHAKFSSRRGGFPVVLQPEIQQYHFLTVVRNPYTWCYSVYKEFYSKDKSFKGGPNRDFGELYPARSLREFHNFLRQYHKQESEELGIGTQSDFLRGIPKNQIELIRFERFEADTVKALKAMGLDASSVPHELNRGRRKREEADAAMNDPAHVSFCNQYYQVDFENFGYAMRDL